MIASWSGKFFQTGFRRFELSKPLVGILAAAFALRMAATLWLSDTVPYSDYFYYHEAGRLSSENWGFWFDSQAILAFAKLNWWPPGYPMFLGLLYEVFGANARVAVFVQVLLGCCSVALIFALVRRWTGPRLAFAAAAVVALNPTFVFYTNLLGSENLFLPILLLAIWFVTQPRRTWRMDIATALAFAGATYVRSVALLWPLFAVLLFRNTWNETGGTLRRSVAARFLLLYALMLSPWVWRNVEVLGSPVVIASGGGLNFYYGHNPFGLEFRPVHQTPMAGLSHPADIDRRAYQEAFSYIRNEPWPTVKGFAIKLGKLFGRPDYAFQANNAVRMPGGTRGQVIIRDAAHGKAKALRFWANVGAICSYVLLAATSVAAIWLLSKRWKNADAFVRGMYGLVGIWALFHVLFWAQPRFRYPMEALMVVCVILAVWLWKRSTVSGEL